MYFLSVTNELNFPQRAYGIDFLQDEVKRERSGADYAAHGIVRKLL